MKKYIAILIPFLVLIIFASCQDKVKKDPIEYVNPYMGNISHLLVPTYPTIHLPNSMLRVYPERDDYTSDKINGLPLIVTSHRGRSAFRLSPIQTVDRKEKPGIKKYTYDNEKIKPYGYEVLLDEKETYIKYAVSHQSGIYNIKYTKRESVYLMLSTDNGYAKVDGNKLYATQNLDNNTQVFIYAETDIQPIEFGILDSDTGMNKNKTEQEEGPSVLLLYFGDEPLEINVKYGMSFISLEQAQKNLQREIQDFDLSSVERYGKNIWNEALSKIKVKGDDLADLEVFYTSLYRTFERPVNISEDGRYFSAFDGKIHNDEGVPFYTDDWIWDSYRAAHPLRVLIDQKTQSQIINSFLRMTDQMPNAWMPTFPEITGDSRRMNSNHGVSVIADAYVKGMISFDLEKAYEVCRRAIEEKTLAPWSGAPSGWLDQFYKDQGYIPALYPGEEETVPEVNHFEKRQPIAVTLGTAYDEWCLAQIASKLGKESDYEKYEKRSFNYRNVYNPKTSFFHPKDKDGKFIEPFDYRYSGGQGAREYYGENNAWIYRWDVPHNIADLVSLMGGTDAFDTNMDQMFNEPLGRSKFDFYQQLPDHTGNVGQFSMANEPSLHIPYLYNYVGKPWKTQKKIHTLLDQWFRNDLMGVPGDEDGGGLSSFVVFSMLGFYPVTPGMPVYVIGSPFFETATVNLENGKAVQITTSNYAKENKYIQSMTIDGKEWNQSWFSHNDIKDGAIIHFVMGSVANKKWASASSSFPPSFKYID
ncbi:GH92 family glycosyl hydrolase [Dysgonomonas massiliensis]|uniref:GH92 family glycosyl hydrolase n=1 Tax=Dysgonomonas massiliensis TaxID=2040292 RepID=UPI000C784646|nr:GH92 family glycosyl hydrolase [Dysgonomonas massiliensis]